MHTSTSDRFTALPGPDKSYVDRTRFSWSDVVVEPFMADVDALGVDGASVGVLLGFVVTCREATPCVVLERF